MSFLPTIAAAYAVLSLLTCVLYGVDKSAALAGTRRVPERTLHLLAMIGGWPGAFVGQRLFRHKTSKAEFQRVFWLTGLVPVAIVLAAVMV